MRHALICLVASTLFALPAAAQNERPRPRPVREELRHDLEQQLERLRMRERWLERQIQAIDRGETPERPDQADVAEPDQPRELTPEDNAKFIAVLRDLHEDRELAGDESPFKRVLETDGPERDRLLRRLAPRLQRLVDLKDTDPERYEATKQEMVAGLKIARAARELSMTMRDKNATPESQAQAKDALRSAIAAGFDARAAMTRYELRDAQARLEDLTSEVAKAESERDQRISEQFERMLRRIETGADGDGPDAFDRPTPQRERGPKPPSRND